MKLHCVDQFLCLMTLENYWLLPCSTSIYGYICPKNQENESFHNQLAHSANTSLYKGLADYPNLIGTCRHHVCMTHRVWWNGLTADD